jgi:hypothetical protein
MFKGSSPVLPGSGRNACDQGVMYIYRVASLVNDSIGEVLYAPPDNEEILKDPQTNLVKYINSDNETSTYKILAIQTSILLNYI